LQKSPSTGGLAPRWPSAALPPTASSHSEILAAPLKLIMLALNRAYLLLFLGRQPWLQLLIPNN